MYKPGDCSTPLRYRDWMVSVDEKARLRTAAGGDRDVAGVVEIGLAEAERAGADRRVAGVGVGSGEGQCAAAGFRQAGLAAGPLPRR